MRKILVLLLLNLLIINQLSAQIDSTIIQEVPLMTRIALRDVHFGDYTIFYRGKLLKLSKDKKARTFISPNQFAIAGATDTLFFIKERDTAIKIIKIVNPILNVKFDNFSEHSSSDVFLRLNPPRKILINILNLSDDENLLNKIYLKDATFSLYSQDSLVKVYNVNNVTLNEMFSDLRRKYRPGYYLSLSHISTWINNYLYQSKEEYFKYLFK